MKDFFPATNILSKALVTKKPNSLIDGLTPVEPVHQEEGIRYCFGGIRIISFVRASEKPCEPHIRWSGNVFDDWEGQHPSVAHVTFQRGIRVREAFTNEFKRRSN